MNTTKKSILFITLILAAALSIPHGAISQSPPPDNPIFVEVPSPEAPTIQKAINLVAEGGTVLIKFGDYEVNQTIHIGKRVTIIGAGSSSKNSEPDKITRLIALRPTEVNHGDDQFAVFTYTGGCGGELKNLDIIGADVGVWILSSEGTTENTLMIENTLISDSGRGIWCKDSIDFTISESVIRNCLHNGVSYSPTYTPTEPMTKVTIVDTLIANCAHIGAFFKDSMGLCINDHFYFNDWGGVVGIGSNITVTHSHFGWNHFASISLFWCNTSYIEHNNIVCTLSMIGTDRFGDGIIAVLCPALTVHDNLIEWPERTGVNNLGSVILMLTNTIHCASFDLEIDTVPAHSFGPGNPPNNVPGAYNCITPSCLDNQCGCPDASGSCHAQSVGMELPQLIPPFE